jgi:hypothetical protein
MVIFILSGSTQLICNFGTFDSDETATTMHIYYIIGGMSLFFLFIAFVVTEGNARYLLAGYNMMSKSQQDDFDIKGYIAFFRSFHIFLAVSFVIVGFALHYAFGDSVSGFFLVAYPLLAYMWYLVKAQKFHGTQSRKVARIGVWVLLGVVVLTIAFLVSGMRATEVTVHEDSIELSGTYGMRIPFDEIYDVALVQELPELRGKTNGYAVAHVRKGDFKLENRTRVRLLADLREPQHIEIQRKDKPTVYLSSSEIDEGVLYDILTERLR